MLKTLFFRIAFISWLVFVTFSSLFSFSGVDTSGFNIPYFDKIVHFTFYFVMVFCGVLAVREQSKGRLKLSKVVTYVLLFSIVYGIIIEVLQYALTENRHGDFLDALANTFGAFMGALLVRNLFSGKWQLKWRF